MVGKGIVNRAPPVGCGVAVSSGAVRVSIRRGWTDRRGGAAIVLAGALALVTACQPQLVRPARGLDALPEPTRLVPVATVLNSVKCDWLDFAYSDYARAQRLTVGKISGTIRFSLSRNGTALGVPVAPDVLRVAEATGAAAEPAERALAVPIALDPKLALDPAGARLDCAPGTRLDRAVLDFTALAAALTEARERARGVAIGSPLRYRGQFYLRSAGDARIEVVPVRIAPAQLGAAAVFLQDVELSIETGTPSWFADVGAATAEPRPRAAPRAVPRATARPAEPVAAAPAPRVRVPTAPRPAGMRRASERRCIADPSGEVACY